MGDSLRAGLLLAAMVGASSCADSATAGTAMEPGAGTNLADAEVDSHEPDPVPPWMDMQDASVAPHPLCQEGAYEGTFACSYQMFPDAGLGDLGAVPAEGPVKLTLRRSAHGEFYVVTGGEFSGDASGVVVFNAKLVGDLDCGTGMFTGELAEGKAKSLGLLDFDFGGPLAARYDHAASAFVDGTWVLTVAQTGGACLGSWSAAYVGP